VGQIIDVIGGKHISKYLPSAEHGTRRRRRKRNIKDCGRNLSAQ